MKFLVKIENVKKNENFAEKSILWPKTEIFVGKFSTVILIKNIFL